MTQNEINEEIKKLVARMQELLAMTPDDNKASAIIHADSDSGYESDDWSSY